MSSRWIITGAATGLALLLAGPALTNPRLPFPPQSFKGKFGDAPSTPAPTPAAPDPAPEAPVAPPPPVVAEKPKASSPPRASRQQFANRPGNPRLAAKRKSKPVPQVVARKQPSTASVKVAVGAVDGIDHQTIADLARSAGEATIIDAEGREALKDKSSHLAISPTLAGVKPEGLRQVARLMDAMVVVVVRDPVTSPADLNGQAVQVGAGDDDASVARRLLGTLDLTVTEERSKVEDALDAVAGGTSKAAVLVALKGSDALKDALRRRPGLHVMSLPEGAGLETTDVAASDAPGADETIRVAAADIGLFARAGRPGPQTEIVVARLKEGAEERRETLETRAAATSLPSLPAMQQAQVSSRHPEQWRSAIEFEPGLSADASQILGEALKQKAERMRRGMLNGAP